MIAAVGGRPCRPSAVRGGSPRRHAAGPARALARGAGLRPGSPVGDFFDWLTGVDELDAGVAVLAHVYSLEGRHHLMG